MKDVGSFALITFVGIKIDHSFISCQAVIASNGRLTPNYEYIEQLRLTKKRSNSKAMDLNTTSKKVLILGAGYVAPPVVDYLSRGGDIMITVGKLRRLICRHPTKPKPDCTISELCSISGPHFIVWANHPQ